MEPQKIQMESVSRSLVAWGYAVGDLTQGSGGNPCLLARWKSSLFYLWWWVHR